MEKDAAEDETLELPVTKNSHKQSKVNLVAGKNLLPSFLSANGGQGFTRGGLLEEVSISVARNQAMAASGRHSRARHGCRGRTVEAPSETFVGTDMR